MSIIILFWCVFYILLCKITLYLFCSFSCISVLVPMFIIHGLLNTEGLVLYSSKNRLKTCEWFTLLNPQIPMQRAQLTALLPFYRMCIYTCILLAITHIGPKWCWQIRLQDLKSNISLEQSNETVYFFTCWYQKLSIDRKVFGWVWSEMVAATLVTRRMDEEWMNWADFSC